MTLSRTPIPPRTTSSAPPTTVSPTVRPGLPPPATTAGSAPRRRAMSPMTPARAQALRDHYRDRGESHPDPDRRAELPAEEVTSTNSATMGSLANDPGAQGRVLSHQSPRGEQRQGEPEPLYIRICRRRHCPFLRSQLLRQPIVSRITQTCRLIHGMEQPSTRVNQ